MRVARWVMLPLAACSLLAASCVTAVQAGAGSMTGPYTQRVPVASLEAEATAKEFDEPQAGSAVLYIVRTDKHMLSMSRVALAILIDNRFVASMPPHTFARLTVIPGPHTVSMLASYLDKSDEHFEIRDGKTYFVEVDLLAGVHASALFNRLDATQGKSEVLASKMVAQDVEIVKEVPMR